MTQTGNPEAKYTQETRADTGESLQGHTGRKHVDRKWSETRAKMRLSKTTRKYMKTAVMKKTWHVFFIFPAIKRTWLPSLLKLHPPSNILVFSLSISIFNIMWQADLG